MLTMSPAAKRMPTFDELYAEIERLPQRLTGQILVPGVLTTMSRPGAGHDHALANGEHALGPFDQRLGGHGWWIRHEYEVRFPGDRLAVPDLAGASADSLSPHQRIRNNARAGRAAYRPGSVLNAPGLWQISASSLSFPEVQSLNPAALQRSSPAIAFSAWNSLSGGTQKFLKVWIMQMPPWSPWWCEMHVPSGLHPSA